MKARKHLESEPETLGNGSRCAATATAAPALQPTRFDPLSRTWIYVGFLLGSSLGCAGIALDRLRLGHELAGLIASGIVSVAAGSLWLLIRDKRPAEFVTSQGPWLALRVLSLALAAAGIAMVGHIAMR